MCSSKKEKESQRFFIIGVERIKRGHKVALQATFTPSLLKVIFGIDAGLDSTADVLVKQSRCRYIFHVWSADRINEILSFTNEVASKRKKKGYLFQLCGKVDYNDGENTKSFYVLHESRTHIQMITVSNRIVNIRKLKYIEKDISYIGTEN